MSWHQRKVKETPSKSVDPQKRRYQATIYNSLPSGTPLFHYNTQKNHTEPSYNNHSQHRTLEECWGLPKPQIDHFNKIPDAFGHLYDSKELDSFRCIRIISIISLLLPTGQKAKLSRKWLKERIKLILGFGKK